MSKIQSPPVRAKRDVIIKTCERLPTVHEKREFIRLLAEIAKRVAEEMKQDVKQSA